MMLLITRAIKSGILSGIKDKAVTSVINSTSLFFLQIRDFKGILQQAGK